MAPEMLGPFDRVDQITRLPIIPDPDGETLHDGVRTLLHLGAVACIALHLAKNVDPAIGRDPNGLTPFELETLED